MSKGPNNQLRWIDIFWNAPHSEPDMRRLTKRLSRAFFLYLFTTGAALAGHFYWASVSGDASNFARCGGFVVGISILAFGYKKHLIDHERWRFQHKIELEGQADGSFLSREHLEWSGRFFDGVNVAIAGLGTFIGGYGDLWFSVSTSL